MARRTGHIKKDLQDLIIGETTKVVDRFGATNISARNRTRGTLAG